MRSMEVMIGEVKRCGNIVKNLLLFSKHQVAEFGLVPVVEIVDRAVRMMQHHFKISNVRFHSEIAIPEARLLCDESQIQQALMALFVALAGRGSIAAQLGSRPVDEWIKTLDGATRVSALKIPEVVAAMKLQPGQTVADIGAGTGFYSRRIAARVGAAGRVYAVDVQPQMIAMIEAASRGVWKNWLKPRTCKDDLKRR